MEVQWLLGSEEASNISQSSSPELHPYGKAHVAVEHHERVKAFLLNELFLPGTNSAARQLSWIPFLPYA